MSASGALSFARELSRRAMDVWTAAKSELPDHPPGPFTAALDRLRAFLPAVIPGAPEAIDTPPPDSRVSAPPPNLCAVRATLRPEEIGAARYAILLGMWTEHGTCRFCGCRMAVAAEDHDPGRRLPCPHREDCNGRIALAALDRIPLSLTPTPGRADGSPGCTNGEAGGP